MKSDFPIMLVLALSAISPVWGHDPSLHRQKDAAPPDCAVMKAWGKMDMSDPLMKALHDKCKGALSQVLMPPEMKDRPRSETKGDSPSHDGGKSP